MVCYHAFFAERIFAYASDATPVSLRVNRSSEWVRECNTRHGPSPQSPFGGIAIFMSSLQALALDADVADFNGKEQGMDKRITASGKMETEDLITGTVKKIR